MAFGPSRIHVQLTPDRVTLTDGDGEWSYPTQVWLDATTGKVGGIGDAPVPGMTQAGLFDRDGSSPGMDRTILLEAFFFRAIDIAVRQRFLRMKPKVVVAGIDSLGALLNGYQRSVIRSALTAAGAMEVRFE